MFVDFQTGKNTQAHRQTSAPSSFPMRFRRRHIGIRRLICPFLLMMAFSSSTASTRLNCTTNNRKIWALSPCGNMPKGGG